MGQYGERGESDGDDRGDGADTGADPGAHFEVFLEGGLSKSNEHSLCRYSPSDIVKLMYKKLMDKLVQTGVV